MNPMQIGVRLCCVAALLLPASLFAAEKDKPAPVSPQQVAEWVRALDSDVFLEREEATEHLIGAGNTAIDQLAKLDLPAQNLEVLTRGIHVLQQLALADDVQIEDSARTLLEKLAESKNPTAARRAESTLGALNSLRQERTIAQLKELNVRVSTNTTQVGLVLVQEVPTVEIDDTFSGTAEDLKRLKYLEDVRLVQLSGEKIDDEVLRRVAEIKSLQFLKVKWAKVTNAGLEPFAALPELQHVSVLYSPIDDEAIPTLAKIKTLNNVRLFGTKVTRPAAMRLDAMLGGGVGIEGVRKVDHRQGAFLGIGGDKHTRGCEVTVVQPNTVAQKAGIQPGDVILKFAGEEVADFEALTLAIGKYKARDTVEFELLRDGATKKIQVTLGEWDW
jgi:hypothetical protein